MTLLCSALLSRAKDYTLSWISNEEETANVAPESPGPSTRSPAPADFLYVDQTIGAYMRNILKYLLN